MWGSGKTLLKTYQSMFKLGIYWRRVHFLSSLLSVRSLWPVNVSGTWGVASSAPSDPQEVSGHGDGWLEDQGRLPLCVWADEIHKTRSDGNGLYVTILIRSVITDM